MKLVRWTVVGVAGAYTLLLFLSGLKLDGLAKTAAGLLPAIATAVILVWDLWAWRWPGLHKLTRRARIDGLWEVTLKPTAASHIPEGGNRGPITAYLLVTQSWWSTYVEQLTAESKSTSRASVWEERSGAPVGQLSFLYDNDPDPDFEHRSLHHRGACTLDPGQLVPETMHGTYFTGRYTKGSMRLRLIDRSRSYSTFVEAAAAANNGN